MIERSQSPQHEHAEISATGCTDKDGIIAIRISQDVYVDITWEEKLCRGTASATRIDKEIFGKSGC